MFQFKDILTTKSQLVEFFKLIYTTFVLFLQRHSSKILGKMFMTLNFGTSAVFFKVLFALVLSANFFTRYVYF
uniref:Uncharacterized protein n=1 Tax=Strongyloides venezuelensis TaxID=75913 RepID=A0A0K0FLW5_STRVS